MVFFRLKLFNFFNKELKESFFFLLQLLDFLLQLINDVLLLWNLLVGIQVFFFKLSHLFFKLNFVLFCFFHQCVIMVLLNFNIAKVLETTVNQTKVFPHNFIFQILAGYLLLLHDNHIFCLFKFNNCTLELSNIVFPNDFTASKYFHNCFQTLV